MLKNYKFVSKNLVKIKSNNNYIKKGHVNVGKKTRNIWQG